MLVLLCDAGERHRRAIGFGGKPPGELDQFGDRGFAPELVDGGPTHFAIDPNRRPHRRNENDIALQQLGVVLSVPADQ